jgi:hypothetical protein
MKNKELEEKMKNLFLDDGPTAHASSVDSWVIESWHGAGSNSVSCLLVLDMVQVQIWTSGRSGVLVLPCHAGL